MCRDGSFFALEAVLVNSQDDSTRIKPMIECVLTPSLVPFSDHVTSYGGNDVTGAGLAEPH